MISLYVTNQAIFLSLPQILHILEALLTSPKLSGYFSLICKNCLKWTPKVGDQEKLINRAVLFQDSTKVWELSLFSIFFSGESCPIGAQKARESFSEILCPDQGSIQGSENIILLQPCSPRDYLGQPGVQEPNRDVLSNAQIMLGNQNWIYCMQGIALILVLSLQALHLLLSLLLCTSLLASSSA